MIFYHGTSEEAWEKIQAEGVLFGKPWEKYDKPLSDAIRRNRSTYLSPVVEVSVRFGPVLLQVEYEPQGVGSGVDNYGFHPPPGEECWQMTVFVPIPLSRVKRIK